MALSVKSVVRRIPPAVSRHAALWRPDFPLVLPLAQKNQRLPVRQARPIVASIHIAGVIAGVAGGASSQFTLPFLPGIQQNCDLVFHEICNKNACKCL